MSTQLFPGLPPRWTDMHSVSKARREATAWKTIEGRCDCCGGRLLGGYLDDVLIVVACTGCPTNRHTVAAY